jgi:hypothetical protein
MPHRLLRFRGVSLRLSGQVFRSVNHEGAYQRTDRSVEGSARPAAGRDKADESAIAPAQSLVVIVVAVAAVGVSGRRLDDRERHQEAAAPAEPSAAFPHSPARK